MEATMVKRGYVRWWDVPTRPFCPECDVLCKVYRVMKIENIKKQFRKCPACGHRMTTTVPAPSHR